MGNQYTDKIGKLVEVTLPLKELTPETQTILDRLRKEEREQTSVKGV